MLDKRVAARRLAACPDGPPLDRSSPLPAVGRSMPNTPPSSTSNARKARVRKPNPAQLHYLRILAVRTGTTFAYPATMGEASREITRLKAIAARSDQTLVPGDTRRDRRHISRELAERNQDATVIRDNEIIGYGSSARWA
jgi:hypothetical protein